VGTATDCVLCDSVVTATDCVLCDSVCTATDFLLRRDRMHWIKEWCILVRRLV